MANGFQFDVDRVVAQMEHCAVLDLLSQQLTVFAVVCIDGDDKFSHGGQVTSVIDGAATTSTVRRAIDAAVAGAIDCNEDADEGHECKYVPVGIGIPVTFLDALHRQLLRAAPKDDAIDEVERFLGEAE